MIIIKSTIDKPAYRIETISIPEPESLLQKVVRKITKEPRKDYKVEVYSSSDSIKMTIIDEVDVREWMRRAYDQDLRGEYKKEIQATDKDGITYLFKGCFPTQWVPATSEATLSVDCFEIKETLDSFYKKKKLIGATASEKIEALKKEINVLFTSSGTDEEVLMYLEYAFKEGI